MFVNGRTVDELLKIQVHRASEAKEYFLHCDGATSSLMNVKTMESSDVVAVDPCKTCSRTL